jgi:DNA-binding transcriptional regulator YiaG
MYHYRSCGLPNVYLKNGYTEHTTDYGVGVSIDNVEGLHKAIALAIIESPTKMTGAEFRFLRKELNLSQKRLGDAMGVEDQTVAGWEKKHPTSMAGRLLRILAKGHYENDKIKELLEKLADLDSKESHENLCFEESSEGWHNAA